MTEMATIGMALGARMETSIGATFTLNKIGPVWRVKYRDEHGGSEVTALQVQVAVLELAKDLGIR